jgi:hypothetical protein
VAEKEKASARACAFARLEDSVSIELRAQAGMKEHKREKVELTEKSLKVLDTVVSNLDYLVYLQNVVAVLKLLLSAYPVILD